MARWLRESGPLSLKRAFRAGGEPAAAAPCRAETKA